MTNEDLTTKLRDCTRFILKKRGEAEEEYKKYFMPASNLEIHSRAIFQGMSCAYNSVLYELSKIPELSDLLKAYQESSVIPQYIRDYFNKPEEERGADFVSKVAEEARKLPDWMKQAGFHTFHKDRQTKKK